MVKRVLVTGGCGFLGQHLTQELLAVFPSASITLLDLRENPYPVYDFSNEKRVTTRIGVDICEKSAVKKALAGHDLVIHLAGIVSFSLKDKALLHRVNVDGTKNIIAGLPKKARLIHISSVAALGFKDDPEALVDERFSFDWRIAERRKKYYMLTKHLADIEVERAFEKGTKGLILYPGLMYGPGDATNASKLLQAVKQGRIPFNMPGGTNLLDVRDVAKGIVAAIKKGKDGEGYLLSGYNLRFKEITGTIARGVGGKSPRLTLPKLFNRPLFTLFLLAERITSKRLELTADHVDSSFKYRYFDNGKARKELGWSPKLTFATTVNDTKKWLEENGLLA